MQNKNIFKINSFIELLASVKGILIETTNKRNAEFNHFTIKISYLGEEYYHVFDINSDGFKKDLYIWEQELRNYMTLKSLPTLTLDVIINEVSREFEIPVDKMLMKSRKREYVVPRQVCHYYAKKKTKMSLTGIGREIGGKDHATVLNSRRIVNNLIDCDKDFRKRICKLDAIFNLYE